MIEYRYDTQLLIEGHDLDEGASVLFSTAKNATIKPKKTAERSGP